MKYTVVLPLAVVLLVSTIASANTVHWGAISGEFTNPNIWWDPTTGTNHAPTSNDTALFYTDPLCTFGAGQTLTIKELYLGEWCQSGLPHNSTSSIVINGSLTTLVSSTVGCQNAGTPTMRGNMTINAGGSFTVNEWLFVGAGNNGTINVNGGNLQASWGLQLGTNIWGSNTGIGTINLNGGTVACNQLLYEADASQIVISDGTLQVWQYDQGLAALQSGHIVAAAGKTLQYRSYNAPFALTGIEITVIPEPATMAILGLGGLLMARRRK